MTHTDINTLIHGLDHLSHDDALKSIKQPCQEMFKSLQNYYISPLSKIHLDIILLKNTLLNITPVIRMTEPSSWIHALPRQAIPIKIALTQLYHLTIYLKNMSGQNVFEFDYQAKTDHSVPYFEWNQNDIRHAITDYLGDRVNIFFLQKNAHAELFTLIKSLTSTPNIAHQTSQNNEITHPNNVQNNVQNKDIIICQPEDYIQAQNALEMFRIEKKIMLIQDSLISGAPLIAGKFNSNYQPSTQLLSVFKHALPIAFIVSASGKIIQSITKNELHKMKENSASNK